MGGIFETGDPTICGGAPSGTIIETTVGSSLPEDVVVTTVPSVKSPLIVSSKAPGGSSVIVEVTLVTLSVSSGGGMIPVTPGPCVSSGACVGSGRGSGSSEDSRVGSNSVDSSVASPGVAGSGMVSIDSSGLLFEGMGLGVDTVRSSVVSWESEASRVELADWDPGTSSSGGPVVDWPLTDHLVRFPVKMQFHQECFHFLDRHCQGFAAVGTVNRPSPAVRFPFHLEVRRRWNQSRLGPAAWSPQDSE